MSNGLSVLHDQALALDAADVLAPLRARFALPGGKDGQPFTYLCGHSLGLMPLAIGLHQPGQEIEGPMAVTVLGGLLSSTLLNLVVLPALAERFGGPRSGEVAA